MMFHNNVVIADGRRIRVWPGGNTPGQCTNFGDRFMFAQIQRDMWRTYQNLMVRRKAQRFLQALGCGVFTRPQMQRRQQGQTVRPDTTGPLDRQNRLCPMITGDQTVT